MGVMVTVCLSAVLWVTLWGIGVKAFDAIMLVIVLMLNAAVLFIFAPLLPGNRARSQKRPDNPPIT